MLNILLDCIPIFSRTLNLQERTADGKISVVRNWAEDHIVRDTADGFLFDFLAVLVVIRPDGGSCSAVFEQSECLDVIQRRTVFLLSQAFKKKPEGTFAVGVPDKG